MNELHPAVARHLAAFGSKDAAAEPWADDAELVTPGGALRGREQILEWTRGYWEAFPDARLEVVRSVERGDLVAAEGKMTGTHTGVLRTPNGDVPPTGRSVEIRWMGLYETRREDLLSEHLYFDTGDFMAQLGMAPVGLSSTGVSGG